LLTPLADAARLWLKPLAFFYAARPPWLKPLASVKAARHSSLLKPLAIAKAAFAESRLC